MFSTPCLILPRPQTFGSEGFKLGNDNFDVERSKFGSQALGHSLKGALAGAVAGLAESTVPTDYRAYHGDCAVLFGSGMREDGAGEVDRGEKFCFEAAGEAVRGYGSL